MVHIVAPGIAFLFFLTIGFVCHSYRDVANRHADRPGNAFGYPSGENDSHDAGH